MSSSTGTEIQVGGPWFEDFEPGQVFDDAPGLTLTEGHTALHQAVAGDRLRLALDAPLCRAVTGSEHPLVHPNLVCDVAIGQSTGPTQRVRGNLFYRGLVLARPVFIGDTLRTRTEVVGLKQNRRREGAPATGLVALRIRTVNQNLEEVLDFWRCPMIPLRDPEAETGHSDSFERFSETLDPTALEDSVPGAWRLDLLRENTPAPHHSDLEAGSTFVIEGGETVTAAPELARLTLNVAMAHTDATSSGRGRRLVYGGHTISVAAAHATRAIPAIATILAWDGCDHLGPVFEGDVLRTELHVEGTAAGEQGGRAQLRALVSAVREEGVPEPVLDWRFVALVA
ncbi:MAG: MaoC family dehydratase [Actinomycetota bacterium]|nr:MaoC family dehydratase [Actinomycetota bacterium]